MGHGGQGSLPGSGLLFGHVLGRVRISSNQSRQWKWVPGISVALRRAAGGHQRQVARVGAAWPQAGANSAVFGPRRAQAGRAYSAFLRSWTLPPPVSGGRVAAQRAGREKRFVISTVGIYSCVIFVGDGGADFLQRRAVAGRIGPPPCRTACRPGSTSDQGGVFFRWAWQGPFGGKVRGKCGIFGGGFWPRDRIFWGTALAARRWPAGGIGRVYAAMHPCVTFGASSPYRGAFCAAGGCNASLVRGGWHRASDDGRVHCRPGSANIPPGCRAFAQRPGIWIGPERQQLAADPADGVAEQRAPQPGGTRRSRQKAAHSLSAHKQQMVAVAKKFRFLAGVKVVSADTGR